MTACRTSQGVLESCFFCFPRICPMPVLSRCLFHHHMRLLLQGGCLSFTSSLKLMAEDPVGPWLKLASCRGLVPHLQRLYLADPL